MVIAKPVRKLFVIFVLICSFLTGCISLSKELKPAIVERIEDGVTSRTQVEQIFGKPRAAIRGSNRKTLVFYDYTAESWGSYLLHRRLTILYNYADLVSKHLLSESKIPYAIGFKTLSTGKKLDDSQLEKIKKGMTTRSELIEWFGEPPIETLALDVNRVLIWGHAYISGEGKQGSETKELHVLLDSADRVRDFAVGQNLFAFTE